MEPGRIYFYSLVALVAITAAALFSFSEIGGAEFEIENAVSSGIKIPRVSSKIIRTIIYDVPFTSQAPFGRWSDPRQQNGCEEAAALMAMRWARGTDFSAEEAEEEIISISEYEQKTYGGFRDTSSDDTVERIFKGYYNYTQAIVKRGIGKVDMKRELAKGNLVIVPVDGRVLKNPFYTPPGPPEHMIVVLGYDPQTQEFITNDPGTRHGESLRYEEDTLYPAIRDYPTGFREPIKDIVKNMIVVGRGTAFLP